MATTEEQELYLAQQDAEKHWQFLEKWLKMVFIDGYVHGAKHALQGKYAVQVLTPIHEDFERTHCKDCEDCKIEEPGTCLYQDATDKELLQTTFPCVRRDKILNSKQTESK